MCIQRMQPLSDHQVFVSVVLWAKGQGRDREGHTKEISLNAIELCRLINHAPRASKKDSALSSNRMMSATRNFLIAPILQ